MEALVDLLRKDGITIADNIYTDDYGDLCIL